MSPVQFGFCIPAELPDTSRRASFAADVNQALDRATGHFDSAWIVDHLQFGATDVLEGFTTLSYLAALHPRLSFGHAVLCQSFRNPALLAKMGATLQFMSGGRFILGIGAGWHEEECTAYGYDFPSAGTRVTQLDEAIRIIKALWTEQQATFEGTYYRVTQAHCEPRPDPMPPVMVGAFKPKMLRLAARHADWWNVSSIGIEHCRRRVEEFDRACMELGRDPATVRRSWIGGCACAPSVVRLIAYLRTSLRLPIRRICASLRTLHNLTLSPGAIVAQLHHLRRTTQTTVPQLKAHARASPVLHADEPGWREDGQNGYIGSFSTPGADGVRYYEDDPSRAQQVVRRILGGSFRGIWSVTSMAATRCMPASISAAGCICYAIS